MALYSASKAALSAITKSLARELAVEKIRVNAVSVGPIDSPIYEKANLSFEESQAHIDKVSQMQGFPQENENFAKGVSACYAGIAAGKLLIAGGCNFPKIPVHAGGSKKYYRDIYTAELSKDSVLVWQRAGQLPQAMAYGVSVSTADGIICVGGMNEQAALSTTYRIRVANEKAVQSKIAQAQAALSQVEIALDESEIKAPFSGIVTEKKIKCYTLSG